jgi:DNA polymerase eta
MGSITRLLSLDDLIRALGEESGKWVFDACRGICTEEVKSTLKVLPKSITAFKSFSGLGYPELEKWTTLLAGDIMKRVELDSGRNNRMPKSCTLGYTTEYGKSTLNSLRT